MKKALILSQIVMWFCVLYTWPQPAPLQLLTAVSNQGFDIPSTDVECRAGPTYLLVFTFNNPPLSCGAIRITSGIAHVNADDATFINNTLSIPITNVADQQSLTIELVGVRDSQDVPLKVTTRFRFLVGDVNNDNAVNAADVARVKAESGNPITLNNFRCDVNKDATIGASDVGLVKSKSGHDLRSTVSLTIEDTPAPNIAGYRIHYSDTSGVYYYHKDVGLSTSILIDNLPVGSTYYFVATSYNTVDMNSPNTAEIHN